MSQLKQPVRFRVNLQAGEQELLDLDYQTLTDDNGVVTSDLTPFSNVQIYNGSGGANIVVRINGQNSGKVVPAGFTYTLEDEKINRVQVVNLGGSSSTTDVQLDSQETEKQYLREIRNALNRQ